MTRSVSKQSRKRVLVAHNVQRHGTGGMARMLESTHTALEEFGWRTDYFTADNMDSVPPRLRRHTFTLHARQYAREALLRGQPYDVINVHEPMGAAFCYARSRLGQPAIVAFSHGVEQRYWELRLQKDGPEPPSPKERVTFPLLSLWQSRLTLQKADHVFCLNNQDRTYLSTRLHLDPQKITRVIPGSSPEFASVAARRTYGRPCTRLIFSGTWIQRKGIRQLVQAFTVLAKNYPTLKLGVLGAGRSESDVCADFPSFLRDRLVVIPPLTHADCAEVLLEYDFFLLPSFFEGTPLALIEAMSTGIPVITTATASIKDVIEDAQNGFLIAPGMPEQIVTAAERLINDAGLRERLGRQGQLDAANYTWRATAEVVDRVYSQLRDL